MSGEIPDQVYFRIGEVAEVLGVEPHVLRFWESEFPQIRPNRDASKQRLYTRRDVEVFLEIKKLLYEEKFTIPGARKQLGSGKGGTATDIKEAIRSVRDELIEIRELLEEE